MKGLSVVIIGGGAGLGALLAEMAVAEGATALGIIDLNAAAAEAALAPARAAGLPHAFAACDIRTADAAHAAFAEIARALGRVDTLIDQDFIAEFCVAVPPIEKHFHISGCSAESRHFFAAFCAVPIG